MLKTIFAALSIAVVGGLAIGVAPSVSAQGTGGSAISNQLCKSTGENGTALQLQKKTDSLEASDAQCTSASAGTTDRFNQIIATIVNLVTIVVGIIAVIMIIVGGFKYITSGGDSGNVSGAKNTILYALIGLVIVALAQFIVRFVLGKATNTGNV